MNRPPFVSAMLGAVLATGNALAVETAVPPADESILLNDIPPVFGASKYEQRLEEAPSSVTIITAEEIAKYGYRTLGDVLRSVRGLYVTYDRNYSYVGVRGFSRPTDYNSRVLVMIDGHRTNENIFHMAMIGTEGIMDIDLVDRIEVIRGPSSSLYGTSAFFGVINIITKRGRDYQGAEVAAEYGSLNTRKGRATWGTRNSNDTEMLLSASGYASDGQERLYEPAFDTPATNNGIAENLDGDRAGNVFLKVMHGDFTTTIAYMKRHKDVPTASYDSVYNDPNQNTLDRQGYVDVQYSTELDTRSRFTARVSLNSYRYDGSYANAFSYAPYPPPQPVPISSVTRDYGYGQWWTAETQYTTRLGDDHQVVAGLDYQGNIRQDQGNYQLRPYYLFFVDERSSRRWAVFAQDEWRLDRQWILNAGLRHDQYSEWGGSTNPRLALIYLATPATTAKLLYGSAFRAPSPYELYYTPSPNLMPEKIRTTELVLEHALRRNLRAVVSLYHYAIEDLIDQQPDYSFRNAGDARATGIELELDGRLAGAEGRMSYAWQNAEDADTGMTLSNSPQHLAKLNLAIPLRAERIFAGLDLQYVGERDTLAGGTAKAYTVANLTVLARRVVPGLELSAGLYNLADTRYADPGGVEHVMDVIRQDGRGWRVKARYEF